MDFEGLVEEALRRNGLAGAQALPDSLERARAVLEGHREDHDRRELGGIHCCDEGFGVGCGPLAVTGMRVSQALLAQPADGGAHHGIDGERLQRVLLSLSTRDGDAPDRVGTAPVVEDDPIPPRAVGSPQDRNTRHTNPHHLQRSAPVLRNCE